MGSFEEVRALQRWLRKDIKRFRPTTDPLSKRREAVQYANDCCFGNPSPEHRLDSVLRNLWADRWLACFHGRAA